MHTILRLASTIILAVMTALWCFGVLVVFEYSLILNINILNVYGFMAAACSVAIVALWRVGFARP